MSHGKFLLDRIFDNFFCDLLMLNWLRVTHCCNQAKPTNLAQKNRDIIGLIHS